MCMWVSSVVTGKGKFQVCGLAQLTTVVTDKGVNYQTVHFITNDVYRNMFIHSNSHIHMFCSHIHHVHTAPGICLL